MPDLLQSRTVYCPETMSTLGSVHVLRNGSRSPRMSVLSSPILDFVRVFFLVLFSMCVYFSLNKTYFFFKQFLGSKLVEKKSFRAVDS